MLVWNIVRPVLFNKSDIQASIFLIALVTSFLEKLLLIKIFLSDNFILPFLEIYCKRARLSLIISKVSNYV